MILLNRFPDSTANSRVEISANLKKKGPEFELSFQVLDPGSEIDWQGRALLSQAHMTAKRGSELWKKNVFELFLGESQKKSYWEFNFSENGQWNCYFFTNERMPTPPQESDDFQMIDFIRSVIDKKLELKFIFSGKKNFLDPEISLCSILETKGHQRLYFSRSHVDQVPNFHRRSSFFKIP